MSDDDALQRALDDAATVANSAFAGQPTPALTLAYTRYAEALRDLLTAYGEETQQTLLTVMTRGMREQTAAVHDAGRKGRGE